MKYKYTEYTYNKKNIVKASLLKDIKSTTIPDQERGIENNIEKIIKFLKSERAKLVLDWDKNEYMGDLFLNEEINIHDKSLKEYKYNLPTAILLSLLLRSYYDDFFQFLIEDKIVSDEEGEDWIKDIEENTEKVKEILENVVPPDEKMSEQDWRSIRINIISLIYRLILPDVNNIIKEIAEKDAQLETIVKKISCMGIKSKEEVYDKIKNRVNYIEKQIEEVINNLIDIEKLEYETNMELDSGNYSYIQDIINENMEE